MKIFHKSSARKPFKEQLLVRAAREKLRIEKTFKLVKKDRVLDELNLLDKKHKQLDFLRSKLAKLRIDLQKNIGNLHTSEKSIQEHITAERSHLQNALAVMLNRIQKIDSVMKQLTSARQKLTHIAKNREPLKKDKVKIISSIIRQKKMLFDKILSILQNESSLTVVDKHAVEALVDKQSKIVQNLQSALRERASSCQRMTAEYQTVLKDEHSFVRQIRETDKRRKAISTQFKKTH